MASTVIGRIPADYSDGFGDYAPTDADLELLDSEISKRLPDGVSWCGSELIAEMEPGESIEDTKRRYRNIDIDRIIDEAYEIVFDNMPDE